MHAYATKSQQLTRKLFTQLVNKEEAYTGYANSGKSDTKLPGIKGIKIFQEVAFFKFRKPYSLISWSWAYEACKVIRYVYKFKKLGILELLL